MRAASRPLSRPRLPGLDALRAYGAVAVVALHAAVPYAVPPMPGLAWPTHHPTGSRPVTALFWAIESFIMPLFFAISGFGAAQSLRSRAIGDYLGGRVRRVVRPLAGAMLVVLPLELYLWMLGWIAVGELSPKKLISLKLDEHAGVWGLSHLWYLQYLALLSLSLPWVAPLLRRVQDVCAAARDVARRVFGRPIGLALDLVPLTLACTPVLWWAPDTVVGFQHAFLPVPAKLAYSALFFYWGVTRERAWFRERGEGRRSGYLYLIAAVAGFGLCYEAILGQAAAPLAGVERVALAAGLSFVAAAATLGCWRWGLSRSSTSAPIRYVAGASFWMYLAHHPLVALCQIDLQWTALAPEAQFLATFAGALVLSLLTYECLVRRTIVGAFLEGRSATPVPVTAPPADRKAA